MAKAKKTKSESVTSKNIIKKIDVDFWATGLHGAEIGIRQQEQWQSKSRAFSKDMEIFGEYKYNGKKEGFFGIRKKEWEDNNRLIVKLFKETEKSLSWISSIEERNALSVTKSLGANEVLPSFIVIQGKGKQMFPVEKVNTKLVTQGKMGEVYVFFINVKKGEIEVLEFKEKRLTWGCDYEVNNHSTGEMVAFIDSKKFNVGGKVVIEIFNPEFAGNDEFITIITAFATTLKFHDDIIKKIEFLMKLVQGGSKLSVSHNEMELYKNPRRVPM